MNGFTQLNVSTDIEQTPWVEVDPSTNQSGVVERVGLLRNGTRGGRATVALLIRLEDGSTVVAETTFRLWRIAVAAMKASPVALEETMD